MAWWLRSGSVRCRRGKRKWSSPGLPGARSSPLNSNPRALYQHLIPVSICLKMAANAGSMFQYWKRFDLQQLQVSPTFCSNRVASIRLGRLVSVGPPRLSPFRRPPRRLFRERIQDLFLTLMKVALSLIRNWSSLFNSTSIGHCNRPSRGDAAGMRRNKSKIAGLRRRAFARLPLLRVQQLLVERVAVVSPTL